MKYNLGVLNDKEFEILCKDLIESELGLSFQNFSGGADKGIDLRCSKNRKHNIVVQVKHYCNSKYSHLKAVLRNEEIKKIRRHRPRPSRYILMTGLKLTVANVDELKRLMSPHIHSTNDIYGAERICELIAKNKDIERRHFKLWLTSTNVLDRILHNDVLGRSEFNRWRITTNVKKYVPTTNLETARRKLSKNKFIIVTGIPGIGKTTVSHLLIYRFLAKDYKLVSITDKLKEGEDVFSPNPKEKQIFYFDDFLGSNVSELINPRNTENALVSFIERIQNSKNKFLILTSRTTLLKKAEQRFEKLDRGKFSQISKYEVELSQYSLFNRAKILYNHIYHSTIGEKYKAQFYVDKFYLKVVEHRNYSPRLIDFVTDPTNLVDINPKAYREFVTRSLENPSEIWRRAYETQLDPSDKFLVMSLFSLGGYRIKIESLEKAFNARIAYEVANNGYTKTVNVFLNSLKHLIDGIVSSQLENSQHFIGFINPSLVDFLLQYVNDHPDEKWGILRSAVFTEQVTKFFHKDYLDDFVTINKQELPEFLSVIDRIYRKATSIEEGRIQGVLTRILEIHLAHSSESLNADLTYEFFTMMNPEDIDRSEMNVVVTLMEKAATHDRAKAKVLTKWRDLILAIFRLASYSEEYYSIKELFCQYDISFDDFLSDSDNNEVIANHLNKVFKRKMNDDVSLTDEKKKEILALIEKQDDERAMGLLSKSVEANYAELLADSGLREYSSNFEKLLNIDMDTVYSNFKEMNEVVDVKFRDRSIKPEKVLSNEHLQIDQLFQRT